MSSPLESTLYRNAVAALGSKQEQWNAVIPQICAVVGPDKKNHSGGAIVHMVKSEHQLSSDPTAAEPELMKDLLEGLCALKWTNPPKDIQQDYENFVKQFAHRGPPIGVKPTWIFRYINGPGIFEYIADALDSVGPPGFTTEFRENINEAKRWGTWKKVLEYVQQDDIWKALPRDKIPLSGHYSTFVTFDLNGPASLLGPLRKSASEMHSALALRHERSLCFLELGYGPLTEELLHIPTLADAGWFRFFKSALPGEKHGWTQPHKSHLPRCPEAVHAPSPTPTLERIAKPEHISMLPP